MFRFIFFLFFDIKIFDNFHHDVSMNDFIFFNFFVFTFVNFLNLIVNVFNNVFFFF